MTKLIFTDKQLRNKRFSQTEIKIIFAFSAVREKLNVSRLIKTARISRSTFYRHHHTIYDIVPDYEKYILRKYKRIMGYLTKIKGIALQSLYERTLTFMIAHQKIMEFLSEYGDKDFVEKMLTILEAKTISIGKVTDSEMFAIYSREVAYIIEKWMQDGFDKDTISPTINKILHLTDTARSHFDPIIHSQPTPTQNPKSVV